MGLDSEFRMSKKYKKGEPNLLYFRKYYNLDNWIRDNCKEVEDDYIFEFTQNDLDKLTLELQQVYSVLSLFKLSRLDALDEMVAELTDDEAELLYSIRNNVFSPYYEVGTYYSISKFFKLLYALSTLEDAIYCSEEKKIYYWSSY